MGPFGICVYLLSKNTTSAAQFSGWKVGGDSSAQTMACPEGGGASTTATVLRQKRGGLDLALARAFPS